jgi:hypothetical protein
MFRWVNAALRRFLVYGFPLIFVLIEHLLRAGMSILGVQADPKGFIPAAIASAGIGQLFPVVAPKDRSALLPKSLVRRMRAIGLTGGTSEADQALVTTGWICIFVLTIFWAVLVFFSIRMSETETLIFGIKTFNVGLFTYFVGVALAEAKEWS